IRRVAAAVGTSTMAVYTHFGSKDDLVLEVVREAFARLHARMREVPVTDDPVADLVGTAEAYRANALDNANLYRVMFGVNPLALVDPTDLAGTEAVGLDAFEALVAVVARCVEAGVLAGDPGRLALQVWSTAHGAVSLELAGFLGDDGHRTYDAACAAVFAGLPRPRPTADRRELPAVSRDMGPDATEGGAGAPPS
ncbi:MAG TPA: WHG domain-containing protein, partial [Aquihabitans sp.]|nr:WHG domain-containing protein [Aquihabitans sp.]